MRLLECYIKAFGGLREKKIKFDGGLNCLLAENGKGKSTLAAFIKAMLYGLGDSRRQSIQENDRRHYLPWDGGTAQGYLTVQAGGKDYRIERCFGKKPVDDTLLVYDLHAGKPTDELGDCPGEKLFSINSNGFEHTLFLSEKNQAPSEADSSIAERLSDLTSSDGGSSVLDSALRVLDEQRKYYFKKGGGGEIATTRAEIFRVEGEIERLLAVQERARETEERLKELSTARESISQKREQISSRLVELEERRKRGDVLKIRTEVRSELLALEERKSLILRFFGGKVPSEDEINELHFKQRTARAVLSGDAFDEEERAELVRLRTRIGGRYSGEDLYVVRGALKITERLGTGRGGSLFSKRVPSSAEIDSAISSLTGKSGGGGIGIFLLVVGIILAIGSGILGFLVNSAFYYGCCAGGTLALLGGLLIPILRSGRRRATLRGVRDFLISVTDSPLPENDELIQMLIRMRGDLDGMGREAEMLDDAKGKIAAFVCKFTTRGGIDLENLARELVADCERLDYLESRLGGNKSSDSIKAEAQKTLSQIADKLAYYDLKTDDPFGEVKAMLSEYSRLTAEIVSKRNYLEKLSSVGIVDTENTESENGAELVGLRREAERRLSDIDGERGALERRYLSDTASLTALDSLRSERASLGERLAEYEKRLRVIQSTTAYLTRASENVTARYLSSTRRSFEDYSALLRSEGKPSMDTSFATTVTTDEGTHATEALNRGARDLFRLSARLALIDSLYGEDLPFILLDDPFLSYDDGRMRAAAKLLLKLSSDRQIIYFTCSEARAIGKSRRVFD